MKAAIIFIATLSPLIADLTTFEMSSDLSSDQASYDGDLLKLEGNVFLDHDLGQMEAESALLKKGEPTLEFSSIHLKDNVSIFFDDQGKLFSDQAFLNFQTLKGTIVRGDYPVVFHGNDLELFSSAIDLTFIKEDKNLELESLTAREDVHLDYLEDYHLDCDTALYQGRTLVATADHPKSPCHLTHEEDVIDALKVSFDLDTQLITLNYPKGELSSLYSDRKCSFASNFLTWDLQEELLTMRGAIVIHDPSMGTLMGDHLFSLEQKTHLGKKVIQSIETEGKTILVDHTGQCLTSYGTLKLDRDDLLVSCISPGENQLIYENNEVRLLADSASLEYALQQMELRPHAITLHGNVKIYSRDASRPLRKGIADHIHYDPVTKETRLLADKGNRVLFWDDEKKLTLSAPEIMITTNPHSGEETIKGMGAVLFTFTEEEGKRFEHLLKESQ